MADLTSAKPTSLGAIWNDRVMHFQENNVKRIQPDTTDTGRGGRGRKRSPAYLLARGIIKEVAVQILVIVLHL